MSPVPSAATMPISEGFAFLSFATVRSTIGCVGATRSSLPSDASMRACSRRLASAEDSRLRSEFAIVILSAVPPLASGNGIYFTLFPAAFFAYQPSGGLGISCFLQIL